MLKSSSFCLCVLNERKSLLYKIIALPELVDCIVDKVAGYVVEAMSEVMKLLSVMPVVVKHVFKKSKSLFR